MTANVLADYLQLWGVDEGFAVFADGTLGFGFDLTPVDATCLSDDDLNGVSQQAMRFLSALPSGLYVQFVQDIVSGSGDVVAGHVALTSETCTPLAETLALSRATRLRSLDEAGQLPVHRLSLYVRRAAPTVTTSVKRFFKGDRHFAQFTDQAYHEAMTSAAGLCEEIESGLQSFGLKPTRLGNDALLAAVYAQWNPTRPGTLERFDPENLRSSLLFSDVAINERGFSIGGMHHRLLSLKLLPDQTFAGMAAGLRRLPFASRLFLTVHVPDQMKEMESLQTQRRIAYSLAHAKRAGVADLASGAKFADLEALLEQMITQGERVFHASLAVLLASPMEDELSFMAAETLATLRELGGAEGFEEGVAAFPIFAELALPNAQAKERMKRIKTSNLADLLPVYGPWRGHQVPRVLLRSRQGSTLSLDPFDPSMTNSNQLVSGASGSGKSFLTNILLLHMLKESPRVFFVDIGGSYRKLTENLGGQYVDLVLGDQLALNPFDLSPGETAPSPQKIKFLVGLVELMTREEGCERLPRLERAELEQAIAQVYRQGASRRLGDLQTVLLGHPDPLVSRYGRILSSWCGDTPFGRLLDRDTSVSLGAPVVAFDLKGLESYPDLQAVCLYIITDLVWRDVQRDRHVMKFLVFDECWKLLKSDAGLAFIEETFRTFRKYNASAIAISQDIDDFARSKIASAILPNCAVKWVLMQPQTDKSRLKEVLALNDNEVGLMASLTQKKGAYSEVFLIAGSERTVAVVEGTPLELWIATTDPRDLSLVDARRAARPDQPLVRILEDLARDFPRGVSAG